MRVHPLLALPALFATDVAAAVYRAGEWSVDVAVVTDQSRVMLGEPVWLSFTVTNLTDEPLQILVGGDTQNDLGRPSSFTIRAVRSDGRWADVPDAGTRRGGLIGPQDLPARGSYNFRLFLPHWATLTDAGSYDVICRRTIQLLRPAPQGASFTKQPLSEVAVEARTRLEVVPRDRAQLGLVIANLGEQMLEANGEKPGDEAVVALAWIDDPRVVPYFVRALKIRSYTMRFIAVQMFGRYGNDEAVSGLRAALALQAADYDGVTPEKAGELAARIRASAVGALTRCRHAEARQLIVAQRNDGAERVRLAVVQALARLLLDEARPALGELAKDRSAAVREQAERTLAALNAPPNASAAPARAR